MYLNNPKYKPYCFFNVQVFFIAGEGMKTINLMKMLDTNARTNGVFVILTNLEYRVKIVIKLCSICKWARMMLVSVLY